MKSWYRIYASLMLIACLTSQALAQPCSNAIVKVRGDWGAIRIRVEVADTQADRAQGLMNRERLAERSGMLFIYPEPQSVSFWMRNTLIPLDMLFLDKAGRVRHIHHRAKPLDETLILGGDNVLSVLEINGGLAKKMGIVPGAELQSPLLPQKSAAWPCP